ncbi:MAG TPA: hypothetical protein VF619_01410 [Allosphingosinicella sp.]
MAEDRWAWFKKHARVTDIATAVAGAAGVIAAALSLSLGLVNSDSDFTAALSSVQERELAAQFSEMRRRVAELRRAQDALLSAPSGDPAANQIKVLNERLQAIEQRQGRIERALLADPVRALEVPMLRRDLESLRDAQSQGLTAVRQSVDQVYDLTKWLLGALAVGILSLAISNYFTRKA